MNIKVTCVNYSHGKEKPYSAILAALSSTDIYNRDSNRVLVYQAGRSPKLQSELSSAIIGLCAIRKAYRNLPVKLCVSQYVVQSLEKVDGVYKVQPKKYIDTVNILREIVDQFPQLTVCLHNKEDIAHYQTIVKQYCMDGGEFDSGTLQTAHQT